MDKLNNEIMNHKKLMSAINRLPILIPKRFPTASTIEQGSNYDELESQATFESKPPARESTPVQVPRPESKPKRAFTETRTSANPRETVMERIVRETMTRHLVNKEDHKETVVVTKPTTDSIQTSATSISNEMKNWNMQKELQRKKLVKESRMKRIQEERVRRYREQEMKRKNLENERLRMNLEKDKRKIAEYQKRGGNLPLRDSNTKSTVMSWRNQPSRLSTNFGEITPGWRSETEVVKAILAKRMTGTSGPEIIAKSGMSDIYLKTIRVAPKAKPKINKKIPFGSSLPRDLYSLWKIPNCQLPYCRPSPFKKTPDEIKVINTSPFAKPGESRSEELMRVGKAIIGIPCRFRYTGSHGELRDRVLNTLQFETTLQDKAQAYIKAWEDFENHTKPFYSKADDACFLPKLSAGLIDGCLKEGVDLGLRRVNSDTDLEPGVYRQRYGKEDVYEEEVIIVEKLTMEEVDRLRELPRRTLMKLFGSSANLNDELLEEKVLMLPLKPKRKASLTNKLKTVNEADETESAMMERVERKLRPSYHSAIEPPKLPVDDEDIPEAFKKMVPKVKKPDVPNILKYFMDRRKEGEKKEAEKQAGQQLIKKRVTLPDWPTLVNSVMEENVPSTLKKLFLTKEIEGFAASKESFSRSSLMKPSLSKESVSRKSISKVSASRESVSRASSLAKSVKI